MTDKEKLDIIQAQLQLLIGQAEDVSEAVVRMNRAARVAYAQLDMMAQEVEDLAEGTAMKKAEDDLGLERGTARKKEM